MINANLARQLQKMSGSRAPILSCAKHIHLANVVHVCLAEAVSSDLEIFMALIHVNPFGKHAH
jgi:hypothetical protein